MSVKGRGKQQRNFILLYAAIGILAVAALIFGIKKKEKTSANVDVAVLPDGYENVEIPEFDCKISVELNNNIPYFDEKDMKLDAFESYSELDGLGRCGAAYAKLGKELMPTEPREEIGHIKPSGWHTKKYNGIIEGNYLYNRCHLIAFSLAGENANEKNLITGTRFFNTNGMLPFETKIAEYIDETGNHVMYRVRPVYDGNNLVAKGVQMEAYSVEDEGEGICFNIFVYNYQPGIDIDYSTGESNIAKESDVASRNSYILNKSSKKIHLTDCDSVGKISNKNKVYFEGSLEELIEMGYKPCGSCRPDN